MKQLPPYNQKITLDDEIKELERELATRQRVYPEWTSGLNPKLTPELASKRIAILQKAIERLKAEKAKEGVQGSIFGDI